MKENVILLGRPVKDYGTPRLSRLFFDKNPFKDLSAARMVYSILLTPGVEQSASELLGRFARRGREEAKRIRKGRNPENLLKMMEQQPDSINQWLLKEKILKFSEFAVPEIIERLKDNQDAIYVEMAVDIIHKSEIDCSSQLLKILNSIKDPYTLSLVCMLLGLIGTGEAVKPVWDCYHFLMEKYPEENYEQGPLLALYEFGERSGSE